MTGGLGGAARPTQSSPFLRREISGVGGLLITLSCLSPSIGVFVVGSQILHQVGSGAALCLMAAFMLSLAVGAVYAELGSAFPHTGGEYAMAGRVLGKQAGFAMLATNLVGYAIALSLSGLGIADYLRVMLPDIAALPVALVSIIAVTIIAVLSVKLNATVTGIFLAVEILSLLITAGLGFSHAHAMARLIHPQVSSGAGGLHSVGLVTLGIGASAGIYALNGYGSVVALGEEIRDVRRRIGPVIYAALFVAAVIEILPIVGIIAGAPDLAALSASDAPVPQFLASVGGPTLSRLLSLAVAASLFNAMIAIALIGARQIYGSARDRSWPSAISRLLEQVHPRFGSPWIATLALGAIGIVGCFIPQNLQLLIIANGNVVMYATLCAAVIIGRRAGTTSRSQARMWLYPWPPILALVALAGVVWVDLLDPQTGRAGLIAALAVVAAGALYAKWALGGGYAMRAPPDD